jgi:hypothetical protein
MTAANLHRRLEIHLGGAAHRFAKGHNCVAVGVSERRRIPRKTAKVTGA